MTTNTIKKKEKTQTRPPIVVVMGHVDHGKTTILDWYRKTKVVEQEAGGITQHIGAYEIEHKGKKITFIDTPGHEAFSKMRSRGARVADIAVLVVAADEGVKPQTKEAIDIILRNNIPVIAAINKTDKPEANTERVKGELAEAGILVESYGGKVPSAEVSAKTGRGMDELLEVIQLVAELENLSAETEKPAEGVVIETHLDPKKGITSTLLVLNGTLRRGSVLAVGRFVETVKILEDFRGQLMEEAGASSPVRVIGFSKNPIVGDTFKMYSSREEAEKFIKSLSPEQVEKTTVVSNEEKPVFNIIIKADVAGSKEALEESLKNLNSADIVINIIRSEVGDINESDVKLAMATKLVTIIGFRVKMDSAVRDLAERAKTRIVTGDVIYEVIDKTKKEAEHMIPPVVNRIELGKVKILKVFKKEGSKQIIGGRVEEGVVANGAKADVKRMRDIKGVAVILQLQKGKTPASEVGKGSECGIMADSKTAIEEGDVLEVFKEEMVKRTL